ncbi:uncharacterized protein LOC136093970 [Hydra vulgaris]|uniref:uncharacterized protein LOC136093970 n=1 Tax=Hydra vulgaris TaxID=6087 RepID=UPI0032EA375A
MATLSDVSPNVLQKVTSAILTEAGVDLTDIHCSKSTAFRKMKLANENISTLAKEDVKKAIEASPYPCIIHFDGKTLYEINAGKKFKIDRLAVLVNIEGETQLLGVPPLTSSSGEDQYTSVMNVLKEYKLESKVGGLCFDTTASNTGIKKGSVVKISNNLNKYLLKLACRHHITELRMVHFWKHTTNKLSTGPENPLFQKFKSLFEHPNLIYSPSDLCKFDWSEVNGSISEKAAEDSMNFCKAYIERKGIVGEDKREDRRELAELVVTYLSPSIKYKIRKTGAIHHAHFLAKAIYYLKMQLLYSQLDLVQENNDLKMEIKLIAEFVACFYAKWYLESSNVSKAPNLDMKAIHQMRQFRNICLNPKAVDAVLDSLYKHTWYLDSTMIPLALLDEDLPLNEKQKIAVAILSFKMPRAEHFKNENKEKKDIRKEIEKNASTEKDPPSLAPLVDEFSYLMFSFCGLTEERIKDWLSLPPQYWHTQSSFKIFENYANSLIVINDHSERAVGMMQQYVHRYNNEEEKQNRLISVDRVRSAFRISGKSSTSLTKKRLSDSLSSLAKKQNTNKQRRIN